MSTESTSTRGRGQFFSSVKSFAIALDWDFDNLLTDQNEYLQLLDAIFSKRVDTDLFRQILLTETNAIGLNVEIFTPGNLRIWRISGSGEIDKIGVVAKATGFTREFVVALGETQIDLAYSNLAKKSDNSGVIWIVTNGERIMSRPTDTTESLADIVTAYKHQISR